MVKLKKIKSRTIQFTYKCKGWDLHLYLILGKHYNFIIDTGIGSNSVKPILHYLKEVNNQNAIIVVNTHKDWDHIWGNHVFKDSLIIAHQSCFEALQTLWDQEFEVNNKHVDGVVSKCLPNLTFLDELHFYDDNIHLFYTPGHTVDSICVYDALDYILHTGDMIGDTVDALLPTLETSWETYLNSLYKMNQYETHLYTSGHNQILTKIHFDEVIRQAKRHLSVQP